MRILKVLVVGLIVSGVLFTVVGCRTDSKKGTDGQSKIGNISVKYEDVKVIK